jgi:hypothetical protein
MVGNLSVGGLVAHAGFGSTSVGVVSCVVPPPVRDLFICAKDLMFEANFRRTPSTRKAKFLSNLN